MLSPEELARLAARFRQERPFVGWAIARYAESENLDLPSIQKALKISEADFYWLHLCKRPRADRFAEDVRTIADYTGVDAGVLAAIARRADVLETLAAGQAGASPDAANGTLLAARARPAKNRRPGTDR